MERRRQTDENRSCSVGSEEWLGDRGEQDDRGRDWGGQRKENGKRGGGKESKNKAVAEKQEFMGSCGLTPDFLLSSELLVIGSRIQHHE